MPRFYSIAAFIICMLAPFMAQAQDDSATPAPGELRELRSDDTRCTDGFRCFTVGRALPRQSVSPQDIVDRVNADLDESRHVTMEQFEAANQCRVIYHLGNGSYLRNGVCSTLNGTSARITYADVRDSGSSRWLVASNDESLTIYRVPAERHLTPGERAEEMVNRLDTTTVTATVPAPTELGSWLIELSGLMGEEQAPSEEQVRDVLAAAGRTLVRAAAVDTVAPAPDTTLSPEEVSAPSTATVPQPTTADGIPTTPSSAILTATTSFESNTYFYLWLCIFFFSGAGVMYLIMDKILWPSRARDIATTEGLRQQNTITKAQNKVKEFMDVWNARMENVTFTPTAFNMLFEEYEKLKKKVDTLSNAKTALPVSLPAPEPKIVHVKDEVAIAEAKRLQTAAETRVTELENEHATTLTAKDREIGEWKSKANENKDAKDELVDLKVVAEAAMRQFHEEFFVNLGLGIANASRITDDSQPTMMRAMELVHTVAMRFKEVESGVYNTLCSLLAPDLAFALPAVLRSQIDMTPTAPPEPMVPGRSSEDSWLRALEEGKGSHELERESTHATLSGFPALVSDGPASVPPRGDDGHIPAVEALSGEPTHPAARIPVREERKPAPGHVDDVPFRPSQHAPPPSKVGRSKRKREEKEQRERRTTDSYSRGNLATETDGEPPTREDEKTAIIDQAALDRKRGEARSGKTLTPAPFAATATDPGLEPDTSAAATSEAPKKDGPASSSIFDDVESGDSVTRRKNVS